VSQSRESQAVVGIRFASSGSNDASRSRITTRCLGAVVLIGHYHGLA
jgi:hypothetical protein